MLSLTLLACGGASATGSGERASSEPPAAQPEDPASDDPSSEPESDLCEGGCREGERCVSNYDPECDEPDMRESPECVADVEPIGLCERADGTRYRPGFE